MPTLHSIFKAAGIRKVIWYCGTSAPRTVHGGTANSQPGACQGRGPRAAGWFRDHIAEQGDAEMQSVILTGGIKGWVGAGDEFVEYTDGYDAAVWAKE